MLHREVVELGFDRSYVTTNRGIASWGAIFEDATVAAAILDRLLHQAAVLQIDGRQLPHAHPSARASRNYAPV